MTNVVVVGTQWGDEGKGKIVDWLCNRADIVVRFQGGHNAGHTLVIAGTTYKLSLLPSGIVQGKLSIIGNGVVIDPWALFREIAQLESQGLKITPELLVLADNACLILPLHRDIDAARETRAAAAKIGTTGRGIGPAYEDKVGRRAVRLADLADPEVLKLKIERLLSHHKALRQGLDLEEVDAEALYRDLCELAPRILPYVRPAWPILHKAQAEGRHLLFEGAQGVLLDVDHGTYPYVTSSNTVAGQAATGSGLGPSKINYVLGLVKAYTTRVGEGPFPTELFDPDGARLGERGHEFGTVTGRARRCGWFDATLVRQSVILSGVDGIALTKLDVLDGFETLKICVGYQLGEQRLDYLPSGVREQKAVQPIYETLKGWSQNTRGIRRWEDLPKAAQIYVKRIESLIGARLALLSTSPEREDTLLIEDPFGA